MSELNEEVQSPCISVCMIDDASGLCQGCFRKLEEIQGWWDLDNAQKRTIVKEACQREAAVFGS
jgi:uncharacterized protein